MADDRIKMSGDEFVRKILAGERDFVRIELPSGLDIFSNDAVFAELDSALKSPAGGRLDLRGASLVGLNASRIYFSHAIANYANFSYANLGEANFIYAQLGNAIFDSAYMCKADLTFSDIARASMLDTDLTDVKGLATVLNLGSQHLDGTKTDSENARIIDEARAVNGWRR